MWKRRRYLVGKVIVVVVLLIVVLRLVLTGVALNKLNEFLNEVSPNYAAHVDDLSLSFIRGAYRFEGITAHLKESEKKSDFLKVDYVDVSLAWRDLFQLRIRTDIVVSGLHFEVTKNVINALKSSEDGKEQAEELGETLFPMQVSRLDIQNSSVHVATAPGLPPDLALRLTQIQGRLSNAMPSKKHPRSLLNLKATVQEHATVLFIGEMDASELPVEWLASAELQSLKLNSLNPFLLRALPLTFKDGIADVYAEFKGQKGEVEGYLKPFIKNLDVTGDEKDWKGFKHAGYEIISGAAKYLLRSSADKSVATRVELKYQNSKLDYSLAKIVGGAIEHGYQDKIKPGIENKYQMNYKKGQK